MSVCLAAQPLDYRSVYPVLDPRRTAGPGPFSYGYALCWDGIQIDVTRNASLLNCEMRIHLISALSEDKEIQAWNLFDNNFVDRIGSAHLGLPSNMTIMKAGLPTQPCAVGADTVVLCRYFAWPRGRTALYTFLPQDFWDFWGGCDVTFNWIVDTAGSNLWGNQTPQPQYPLVRLPDFTTMKNQAGTNLSVVFGGAAFAGADDPVYTAMQAALGIVPRFSVPFTSLPPFPADGTLLREWDSNTFFVVFGGAKFEMDWATLFAGMTQSQIGQFLQLTMAPGGLNPIRIIPLGGTANLGAMPIDGTLIRELGDGRVYLVDHSQLRWVVSPDAMDANCLSWRHVRIVPNNALAALPRGPNITA
jgi:hypothetical protein